jgi:gliding motility-associated-like protein
MKTKILIFSLLLCICNLQISAQLIDTIIGDALNLGGNCFLITPEATGKKGGIWYGNPIDFSNDFTIYYQNNFGDLDRNGADGMALVFKTTPDAAIGSTGGGIGYLGINNSLIVEFDTWLNGNVGDPSYDHLAIMKNGNNSHNSTDNLAGPVQASSSSANIEDGIFHDVKVQWDATTQVLSVFFDCELRLALTEDIKNTVFGGDSSVFFGFVGSTGGAINRQEVCFNSISFVENLVVPENENICLGQEINIDATIPSGNSYSWLPTIGVSDAEIANPDFSPTETTDYTVTITDNCGELTDYTVTITVSSISTPTFAQIGAICVGDNLPDLPTTSTNGISGTWLPEINNTATTLYTFTPDEGECSTDLEEMTVIVNTSITPTFTQVAAIFNGETLAALPTTSNNNITGTWSPAINNTETTTYTFTPDASQTCAINQTMTITVNPIPFTVTVNNEIICSNGTATIVATPAPAGFYTYTWTVPVGVNNPGNVQSFSTLIEGDYSVSISKDNYLCNTDFEDNQIVNPGNFIIINQDSVPCWETSASDSKIEVWGDGMNGTDAYSGNQFIELNANVQSTLFQNFEIIPGSSALISFAHRGRNPSADDIMEVEIGPIGGPYTNLGSFSDGTNAWGYYSLEYVFPNDLGINYTIRFKSVFPVSSVGNFLDDISVVFLSNVSSEIATGNVSIINDVIPIFTQVDPICNGDVLALPATSNNGVTGTWSPTMDNTATTIYTFAPDATQPGQTCVVNQTMTITVNPLITPTFTQVDPICNGEALGELPTTSNNGVTGTWSPAMDNTATTIYTFAPDITQPGQACAVDETMTITVNPITPTFTQVDPICNGDVLALPTTSNNGVTGTWAPAIDNTATTTYTFTPDASQTCAVDETMTITVNPITPTFTQVDPICNGDVLRELPTTSINNIIGTWAPAIDNTLTTTYTFTPDASQTCAVDETMTITVNPITPTFTQVDPICNGDVLALPTTSNNGVTGTWSPAMDNTATTIYTFAPDTTQPGQACAVNQTMTITVNPLITPTFSQVDPICNGDVLALPITSNNGLTGTWSPAIDNTATTLYTFVPDATQPGQACAVNQTMTITVNQTVIPIFDSVAAICEGESLTNLPTTSNNSITGTWSPAMNNTETTNYTFTPDAGQCAITSSIDIVVNPIITPFFNKVNPIRSGDTLTNLPSTSNNGIEGTWSPAMNNTATTNYTFTPNPGQCAATSNIEIVISNINNAFSPNGDGVNDIFIIPILFNYLDFEIEVFNRWGTKVYYYNNNGNTSPSWWDGYATVGLLQGSSKPLTVGTYYYIIHLNNKVKEKITGWIYLNR